MVKKIFLILLIAISVNKLSAQVMAAKPEWVTIKTPNIRCWECKDKLEKWLIVENKANMQSGLLQWKFNLLNGEIRFQYLPDRVTVDEIRIALNNAGFDADDEKAEESAYKKLPPICKRNEEGGGPQKGKPCHIEPQQ